jgi:hydrogenase large subunit
MNNRSIIFSPVTRLSGLLSVEITIENSRVIEANASGAMFRGFEWMMQGRKVTDAVYLTQRICGICSQAHGAVSSYLLDELYDSELTKNAQLLRNIMFGAEFLQNHIRHFYFFSLPDFVQMPKRPPFESSSLSDFRLNLHDNERLAGHYHEAVKAAQESHQMLALFGGKAPHQHSFVYGGVAVAPTADKINQAKALIKDINEFVKGFLVPDTELIARVYGDYFRIGITPRRLLSFGLFRFGTKNEKVLLRSGVLTDNQISTLDPGLIQEDIANSWFNMENNREIRPNPYKPGAYTWIKAVKYAGQYFQVGPLARMIINGRYNGGTSTMDRIFTRSIETLLVAELIREWLDQLIPGPPPINQKEKPVKNQATATTDAMRGALLHRTNIEDENILEYKIITPTMWNFSPKDRNGNRGPVESALVDTDIYSANLLDTILGRIIRSFDPCISCATHIINCTEDMDGYTLF